MAWDKGLPQGTDTFAISDNNLRANNAALEAAIDLEHQFTTGSVQTGRHKMGVGSAAARDTAMPGPVAGNIWFEDTTLTDPNLSVGVYTLQIHDGTNWINVGFVDVNHAFLATAQKFTQANVGGWTDLTIAGAHYTWALNDSNFWQVPSAMAANMILDNPTGSLYVTGNAGHFTFLFTQENIGGTWDLTFGAAFAPAWGGQPGLQQGGAKQTLMHVTLAPGPKLIYAMEYI